MRRLVVLIAVLLIVLGVISSIQKYAPNLGNYFINSSTTPQSSEKIKIVTEESVTIDIVKKASPSVVTVAENAPQQSNSSPFDSGPFSFFGIPFPQDQGQQNIQPNQPQSIGSGFILSSDGMIVTNKHVVSDTQGKYQIITNDDKKYTVQKVYRDPLNDVAILKIDPNENASTSLPPINLGNSSNLQVGQYVIAIGTALGEFRNTVTTGVISGLGRGITAGSPFEGFVEKLDNVIQTNAAINPGNSGGPLLNSSGQVIGVNTAVSESGQNIGFAIPINVIKDSLNNFNQTGQFNRPYLGVAYKTISRDLALLDNIPEGAYVQQVVQGSPAEKAGVQQGDIIVKIDGQRISGTTELSTLISKKKVGDTITISVYRDNNQNDNSQRQTVDLQATLTSTPE